MFGKEPAKLLMDYFKGRRAHPQNKDTLMRLLLQEGKRTVPLVSSNENPSFLAGVFEEGCI